MSAAFQTALTLLILYGPPVALLLYLAWTLWRAPAQRRVWRAWIALPVLPWLVALMLFWTQGIEPLGVPRTRWGLTVVSSLPLVSAALGMTLVVLLKGERLRTLLFGGANAIVTTFASLLAYMSLSGNWI